MDHDTLKLEWVTLERLYLNPANPRLNDPAVPHVAASIKRFGWRQPIVAKPSGEVVAGNTRLKAAKSLGMREVPVVWFQGSDLDAVAYSVADNRTHEFAAWDEPALLRLLEELKAEDALDGVGYTPEDIDSLLEELNRGIPPTEISDPGPEEPPEEPVTRAGDLWLLGDQKLLCGDSTKTGDLAPLYQVTINTPEKMTGVPVMATRPKPEANATKYKPGDRVAVGLTSFSVLPNYTLARQR